MFALQEAAGDGTSREPNACKPLAAGCCGGPSPAEPSANESMEELIKLKGLLDSGVLTQAEFDAQNQKILQSM